MGYLLLFNLLQLGWGFTLPFAIKGNVFPLCEALHELIPEPHPTGCKHRWPIATVRMQIEMVELLRDIFKCLFMRIYSHILLINANGNCMHICVHGVIKKKIRVVIYIQAVQIFFKFCFGVKLLLS